MCISTKPSRMASTKIYVTSTVHEGKEVHVLGYANKASSIQANAMILPIPALRRPEAEDFLDMQGQGKFFADYIQSRKRQTRSLGPSMNRGLSKSVSTFKVGSYTILSVDHAGKIAEGIEYLKDFKEALPSKTLIQSLLNHYGENVPFIICAWNGEVEAEPILLTYEPSDPSRIFIPMMDGHDGKAIRTGEPVGRDHDICVGIAGSGPALNAPPHLSHIFHDRGHTTTINWEMPNKDTHVNKGAAIKMGIL